MSVCVCEAGAFHLEIRANTVTLGCPKVIHVTDYTLDVFTVI